MVQEFGNPLTAQRRKQRRAFNIELTFSLYDLFHDFSLSSPFDITGIPRGENKPRERY